ncbi:MAG: glycosyltransferase family 2 protein [Paludibacteraceae bacterium]|nr:glycosyltransferase family 2 protein [Paludibacteraceae bacterium]
MEHIRLSYILPCYNTGPYIRTCIESLYRQSLPLDEFEVIFVNNATEDNSEEIIIDLQKNYPNLIYIKLPNNICTGGAYNAGLDVARGRYIQFVDSDDYLKDNVEQLLLKYAEANDLDMVYFNIESFTDDNRLTHEENLRFNGNFALEIPPSDGEDFIEIYTENKSYDTMPVPAYRKLIRRALFEESRIRFTPTTLGTDYLTNLQLLLVGKKIAASTKRNYMFRYNPSGVTKSSMTPIKNVYGLNNYSAAYLVSKKIKMEQVRSIVQDELKGTLGMYMSYLNSYDQKGLQYVREHIQDKFLLALILGNSAARLLYSPAEMLWFRLKRRLYLLLQ